MGEILVPDILQWDHSYLLEKQKLFRTCIQMANFLLGFLGSGHLPSALTECVDSCTRCSRVAAQQCKASLALTCL